MTDDSVSPEQQDGQGKEEPRFSFTDKRRVNPEDGTVRPEDAPVGPAPSDGSQGAVDPIDAEAAALFADAEAGGSEAAGSEGEGSGRIQELEAQVASLAEELKREQAEYVNSRRRIEASAEAGKQAAAGRVIVSLMGVLDDIDLGRQHGDIVEGTPFQSIATKLEGALASHGLEKFGEAGEEFDPNLHEALMHEDSEEVAVNSIKTVLQPGYRLSGRVLRPARVATYGPQ